MSALAYLTLEFGEVKSVCPSQTFSAESHKRSSLFQTKSFESLTPGSSDPIRIRPTIQAELVGVVTSASGSRTEQEVFVVQGPML